jgi:hypothetical protein
MIGLMPSISKADNFSINLNVLGSSGGANKKP